MARKNSVAPSERQMQQLCSDLMLLIGISFAVAFAIWGMVLGTVDGPFRDGTPSYSRRKICLILTRD